MRKAIVAGTLVALIVAGALADARDSRRRFLASGAFPVRVTSFSRTSADAATFVLVGVWGDVMPDCPTATVRAHYALSTSVGQEYWASWHELHTAALDRLQREYELNAETRFRLAGSIASGLGEDPNGGTCHFISRALAISGEPDGSLAVDSWFKLPDSMP